MFGFGGKSDEKKTSRPEVVPDEDASAIVTEDLLGRSDWHRSKIGWLTGVSAIGGVGRGIVRHVGQSVGRLAFLARLLTRGEELPTLPEDAGSHDGRRRFQEAMRLHRQSEGGVRTAISNTRRSSYLYGAVFVGAVGYLLYGLATRESMPLTTLFLHLAPIPLSAALAFRAAYYNWMFRRRSLDPVRDFVKSREWMPR